MTGRKRRRKGKGLELKESGIGGDGMCGKVEWRADFMWSARAGYT